MSEQANPKPRRNPMDAAQEKGRLAAKQGLPESACPYQDKRVASGRLSFSRAWIKAWLHGYRTEKAGSGVGR